MAARAKFTQWNDDGTAEIFIRRAIRDVADITGIPECDILKPCRQHQIIHARQLVCWAAVDLFRISFPMVGQTIGKDHTTILHAVQQARHLAADPKTKFGFHAACLKDRLKCYLS